ncbi:hypothetical protein AUR64_08330 [Haloprofundus marisrubri]|uniref:RCK N-terminal domain-containing protein n=1 Tax=Haloprofundus marisrubri TaxID=1514971 RepID=A0A0W1R8N1_9EURY|nr:NAD-binding protein [Haloprofundus marisrubri]KTG09642.1 hypothetical protein AUR64_08330 [Haloprofundus marisrubri]
MSTALVVGGGHVGTLLAQQLRNRGVDVRYVDDDAETVIRVRSGGTRATEATLTDARSLREAAGEDVTLAVAASPRDSVNLLVAQLLRTQVGVRTVVVLVNDPRNHEVFETSGIETVCASSVLADALGRRVDEVVARVPPEWSTETAAGSDDGRSLLDPRNRSEASRTFDGDGRFDGEGPFHDRRRPM